MNKQELIKVLEQEVAMQRREHNKPLTAETTAWLLEKLSELEAEVNKGNKKASYMIVNSYNITLLELKNKLLDHVTWLIRDFKY